MTTHLPWYLYVTSKPTMLLVNTPLLQDCRHYHKKPIKRPRRCRIEIYTWSACKFHAVVFLSFIVSELSIQHAVFYRVVLKVVVYWNTSLWFWGFILKSSSLVLRSLVAGGRHSVMTTFAWWQYLPVFASWPNSGICETWNAMPSTWWCQVWS